MVARGLQTKGDRVCMTHFPSIAMWELIVESQELLLENNETLCFTLRSLKNKVEGFNEHTARKKPLAMHCHGNCIPGF